MDGGPRHGEGVECGRDCCRVGDQSGRLYASALIASGGIVGLLGVCIRILEGLSEQRGGNWQLFRFNEHNPLHHDRGGVVMFALLAFSLYYFPRKPLES